MRFLNRQNHWKVLWMHLGMPMHKFRQLLWNNTDFRWIFKVLGDILWPYKVVKTTEGRFFFFFLIFFTNRKPHTGKNTEKYRNFSKYRTTCTLPLVGESDRIWSARSSQIVAVFSEILTLAMQVSVDMNSSVKYLLKPVMQKSKGCN
jgi:hypothetical protein